MYQYFLQAVPTRLLYQWSEVSTYQYAVTQHDRTIRNQKIPQGTPGIFFRYEISPLSVHVDIRLSLVSGLVRLASLVGGVFVSAGLLRDAGAMLHRWLLGPIWAHFLSILFSRLLHSWDRSGLQSVSSSPPSLQLIDVVD
ncbi:unnamed protein product [Protopolystoma xenopodis]|uniref:Endoplasmic reticulum vesicle transporter C-terminal domain-containing protein n=1 Tax=Protopolystoma xenopodis TaxID=117903 RepID=A0A3S4ZBT9_9PLAT|nr:unnamed protein product [Protopolystoma xenopodis]